MSLRSDDNYTELASGFGVRKATLIKEGQWYISRESRIWILRRWDEANEAYEKHHSYWVYNYVDKQYLDEQMRLAETKFLLGE